MCAVFLPTVYGISTVISKAFTISVEPKIGIVFVRTNFYVTPVLFSFFCNTYISQRARRTINRRLFFGQTEIFVQILKQETLVVSAVLYSDKTHVPCRKISVRYIKPHTRRPPPESNDTI